MIEEPSPPSPNAPASPPAQTAPTASGPAPASTVSVEQSVRTFYDTYGWAEVEAGRRGEDKTYRDFRAAHATYAAESQERTASLFPPSFGRLLIAGCGDMPDSHLAIARRAKHVTCVDISEAAVDLARQRVPGDMEGYVASILDLPFPDGSFDAVYCAHVLYHIAAHEQERAVRQMIRVTKPGGRVVILYFNPASAFRAASAVMGRISAMLLDRSKPASGPAAAPALYFHAHALGWWQRFADSATVTEQPWEAMSSKVERNLLWSDGIARLFYRGATQIERRLPSLATRLWVFPAIVLDKRV